MQIWLLLFTFPAQLFEKLFFFHQTRVRFENFAILFFSGSSVSVINDGKYQNSNICKKKIFIYFAFDQKINFFLSFRLDLSISDASEFHRLALFTYFHIFFLPSWADFFVWCEEEHYHNRNNTCHGFIFCLPDYPNFDLGRLEDDLSV